MIISASRRTDIPAFYSRWFMNRIRAGHCMVPNPFNPTQVSRVSLKPEDVDVIVFWTRNPGPLMPHLSELEERGYRFYFLYTLMGNPRRIDPGARPMAAAARNFRELSERIGRERTVWRYDPIFLSSVTDYDFHEKTFRHIAAELRGATTRSVVSFAHLYRKARRRLEELAGEGIRLLPWDEERAGDLVRSLVETARENGMEPRSCADERDLQRYGLKPGKCVDDELISRVFGLDLRGGKDPCQRRNCGCAVSKDIGMYDSCPAGCVYCYATTSLDCARANFRAHDPEASSLLA